MKIYKYPLEITGGQIIKIFNLVQVISVALQYGQLILYAIVDDVPTNHEKVSIRIIGTGHEFDPIPPGWTFRGTHLQAEGSLVWHIWTKEI